MDHHRGEITATGPGSSIPSNKRRLFIAGGVFRRVVSCVAGEAGTLTARLWAVWQRVAPWVK